MSKAIVARPLAILALVGSLAGCVVNEDDASATFFWDPAECGTTAVLGIDLEDLDDGSLDLVDVNCVVGGVTVGGLDPGRYIVTFWGADFAFEEGIRLQSGYDNEFSVSLVVP